MASSSISGLASGLDTAAIIDQLMRLEASSQASLKSRQTTTQSVISALRQLNTDTTLIASSAGRLAKAETWQTLHGTATGTGVSVAVTSSATPSTFSFTVDRLAATHQLGFAEATGLDDVVAGSTVKITHGSTVTEIDTGTGSLRDVVAAINAKTEDTGVRATAIKVADGSYRLVAESTQTGAASAFTLTDGDGAALLGGATVRAGQDAQISLGLGITATSSTNTFTDLTPGVTVTLDPSTAIGSSSTVTVAQSSAAVVSSVSALVDQINALLTKIDNQTAGKTSTTSAGVLAGDATARTLRGQLLETVFGDGTSSLAAYGIQTDRFGKLVFDAEKFKAAHAADPAGVAAKFTAGATPEERGWAARVETVAKLATDAYTGTITTAITGHTTTVDRLEKSIEGWDVRLEMRRKTLERQYTALETALASLQSQSSWLAGQIANLPTYSS